MKSTFTFHTHFDIHSHSHTGDTRSTTPGTAPRALAQCRTHDSFMILQVRSVVCSNMKSVCKQQHVHTDFSSRCMPLLCVYAKCVLTAFLCSSHIVCTSQEFRLPDSHVWFVRFSLDASMSLLACGNRVGKVCVVLGVASVAERSWCGPVAHVSVYVCESEQAPLQC